MSGADDREDEGVRPADEVDELVGVVVAGKYRVQRLVARGGMGRIYLAEQLPLGRSVALKVLDSRYVQSDQDPGFQKRFLQEASMCAKLTHPNTVRIFDYGRMQGVGADTYFMVMEFLEGRTLRQALRQEGPLPPARAVQIVREIARSLREAHRHDLVHRDLKPSNVMLIPSDEGEAVKVLDFGIAKLVRDDTEDLTISGKFIGSPRYMAPEQIRHSQLDGRTDIYALGVLLYETLTGRTPFRGEKAMQTLVMQLNDPPPPLVLRGGPPPPELDALIMRCLSKKASDRYDDMDALIHAIDELPPLPGASGAPVTSRNSLQSSVSRRPGALTPGVIHAEPTPAPGLLPLSDPDDSDVSPARGAVDTSVLARPRSRRQVVLPLVLAVAALMVGLVLVARPWSKVEEQGTSAPATVAAVAPVIEPPPTAPPVAPSAAPSVAEATPKAAPMLRLEITPAGAEVLDGDEVLGRTPVAISLDDGRFAAGPRKLTVRAPGFRPLTLTAEAGSEDVVVRKALQWQGKPVGAPSSRPRPPGDMEIRTTR